MYEYHTVYDVLMNELNKYKKGMNKNLALFKSVLLIVALFQASGQSTDATLVRLC